MECTIEFDANELDIDYSQLAGELDTEEIAGEVDASDVAAYVLDAMDFDELTTDIASRVNIQADDVAENFSACDIAGEIDLESLAECILAEEVARYVDTKQIANDLTTSIEKQVNHIVELKLKELQPPKKESIWHTLTSILRLRKPLKRQSKLESK